MPYVVGAAFIAQHHRPASPTLLPYEFIVAPLPDGLQKSMTQLSLCLESMGREVQMDQSHFPFRLGEALAVTDGRGPQVFRADTMVIKIFDPLYYHTVFPYSGLRPHVVNLADWHHCNEVAVYAELFRKFGGSCMAQYFGSYTIRIPTYMPEPHTSRAVRVIMMENLGKVSMNKVNPASLASGMSPSIMKRVIETQMLFLYHGVRLVEMSPSNVMLVPLDDKKPWEEQADYRVVLIDFDQAAQATSMHENAMKDKLPKPLWPATWHAANPGLLNDFVAGGWVPAANQIAWIENLFRSDVNAYVNVPWTPYIHPCQLIGPRTFRPPIEQLLPEYTAARVREEAEAAAAGVRPQPHWPFPGNPAGGALTAGAEVPPASENATGTPAFSSGCRDRRPRPG
jgi:hypothetical protein